MAFNGSGVFTLVAGNPVVTGTTISSTWANNTLSDIATGLSTTITKDGQTTPTANIPMGGFKFTGLGAGTAAGNSLRFEQLFSQGIPVALASAATVDIGGQNSVAVEISGTTTITSLGTNYNGPRFVRFTGALLLTYNATTLNLPGAVDIVTAAGDVAVFYPNLASDGWNLVSYQRAVALAPIPVAPGRPGLPINGSCQIAQQAVVAITAAYQYSQVDMHLAAVLAGTGISGNLGQFAMTGVASLLGYGVSAGSWTTGNFNWQTRIQGVYTSRLNSKTVTVAAKIFQNTGGARNFKIALYKPTTTLDTFSAQTLLQTSGNTSVPSGTTTQISATFTLGASDATLGLAILVYDADAANTVVSKSYLISDWQLKEEAVASAFILPDFYAELALCEMYYAKTFPYATAPAQNAGATNSLAQRPPAGNYAVSVRWTFPVPMRTTPTVVTYNPSAANANFRDSTAATDVTLNITDIETGAVTLTSQIGVTAGNLVQIHAAASAQL
jgi:hypothetical protein